ncbi:PQQ-binding-like beta-propeller repeat protein [Halobacteriales archaeon Cl-PHB]
MDRRTLLKRGAVVGLSVTLAGCSSGSTPATRPSETPTATNAEGTPARATGTPTDTEKPTPEVVDALDSVEGTWSTHGRDSRRRSAVADAQLPASAPSRRWSIALDPLVGQPLLVDGMVFVQTQAGQVYRLAGATGTVQWVYDLGQTDRNYPVERHRMAIDDDRVYVLDQARSLHAIDRQTGENRWQTTVSSAERSSLIYGQAVPTVVGDRVFLAEHPGRLLGFDRESGDRVVDASIAAAGSPVPTLAAANGSLYAASSGTGRVEDPAIRPSLSKFDPDGTHAWTVDQTSTYMYASRAPVLDGDQVYLTDASMVYAFSAGDGTFQWECLPTTGGGAEYNWYSPAVGANHLVYTNNAQGRVSGGLGGVAPATGSLAWHTRDVVDSAQCEPIVVGDAALVPTDDGVHACSLADGTRRWTLDLRGDTAVIAGQNVLITGAGNTVTAWA